MLALQLLCNGIVTGCALGIVAVSFSFVYATTKIFHVAHAGVYTTPSGAPILNGITNLVKMGEFAVKMDKIMGGTFTSKRLQYAPPSPDQIEEIREYYGAEIYPTVKAPPR